MVNTKAPQKRALPSIILLGACIGALAGLSGSPIGGTLLASLLAVATLALSVIGKFSGKTSDTVVADTQAVDISALAMFSLAVLIAIIPASFLRSEFVRMHSDREVIRSLSAPRGLERIIASWQKVSPELSSEEITERILQRYAESDLSENSSSKTPVGVPIPLRSNENTTLAASCVMLSGCASDTDEEAENLDCLGRKYETALARGGPLVHNIAKILNDSIPDIPQKHIVFGKITSELCIESS